MAAGDTLFSQGPGNLTNTWTPSASAPVTTASAPTLTYTAGAQPTRNRANAREGQFYREGIIKDFSDTDFTYTGREFDRQVRNIQNEIKGYLGNYLTGDTAASLVDIPQRIRNKADQAFKDGKITEAQRLSEKGRANALERLIKDNRLNDIHVGIVSDDTRFKEATARNMGATASKATPWSATTYDYSTAKVANPSQAYKDEQKALQDFKVAQNEAVRRVNALYMAEYGSPEYDAAIAELKAQYPNQQALADIIGPEAAAQAFKDAEDFENWKSSETSRQAATTTANAFLGQQQDYFDDINQIFTDPYNAEGMQDFAKYANESAQAMANRSMMDRLRGRDRSAMAAAGEIEDAEFDMYMGVEQRIAQNKAAMNIVDQMNTAINNADEATMGALRTALLEDEQQFTAFTNTLMNNLVQLGQLTSDQLLQYTTQFNTLRNQWLEAKGNAEAQRKLENAIISGLIGLAGTGVGAALGGAPGAILGGAAGGAASSMLTGIRDGFDPAARLRIRRRGQ